MQKNRNHQKAAREVLAEHRDRLECAFIECTWLEQAHNDEIAVAGERGAVTLALLCTKLRDALVTCDELAALLDRIEDDASAEAPHDVSDTRDTVRATFGDCTVEIKVPDMARPLTAWLQWLESARIAAGLSNRFGG